MEGNRKLFDMLKCTLFECLNIKLLDVFKSYGAMGRQIDPSWGGPIELLLVSASAPRLV